MRGAASSQQAGTPQGEAQARRAAEGLREAQQNLSGLRGEQSSGQVSDLARQAEELARQQAVVDQQMRRAFAAQNPQPLTKQQAGELADTKDAEAKDLKQLERGHAECRARHDDHPAFGREPHARDPGRHAAGRAGARYAAQCQLPSPGPGRVRGDVRVRPRRRPSTSCATS